MVYHEQILYSNGSSIDINYHIKKILAFMGSHPKKNSAEWFIGKLNVDNAKLLAFSLVLGFIGYHGILHLRYGNLFLFLQPKASGNLISYEAWKFWLNVQQMLYKRNYGTLKLIKI